MRRTRWVLGLALTATAASYGVMVQSPTAHALAPAGGCWSYEPLQAALSSEPKTDHSASLQPWTSAADGDVALTTGGATLAAGTRTGTVTWTGGPVVSTTEDVTGTASFLISLDGTRLAEPWTTDFTVEAGDPVPDLRATGKFPVGEPGAHRVVLDAVYLDLPDPALRLACNGQILGVPGGANPATRPEPTTVTARYDAVATGSLSVDRIAGQETLAAARPGDQITLSATGLASSAPVTVQHCVDGACSTAASGTTDAAGALSRTFALPAGLPVGTGTLTVDDKTTPVSTPFTVLDVQRVTAAEALTEKSTVVSLSGTGWDPGREVTIAGFAGPDGSSPVSADAAVVVKAGPAGEFTADFEITDPATESVIAEQVRSAGNIGAIYLISGVIGGGAVPPGEQPGDEPGDPGDSGDSGGPGGTGDTGSGSGTGTGAPTPGSVTVPPAAPALPPSDIPLPGEVPVAEPPAGTAPIAPVADAAAELEVSEAYLAGEATLGELFGGSPSRDLNFLVENVGATTVTSPVVRVSVGRSKGLEPQVVATDIGPLEPGEQVVVSVPVELPIAAFGTYYVVGQVGDGGTGQLNLEWNTYPWGLVVLDLIALGLLVLGVRYRLGLRRKPAGAAAVVEDGAGDSIVDLEAANAWWAYRSGSGTRPRPRVEIPPLPPITAGAGPVAPAADEPLPGEAIVDLDAAERWWASGKNVRAS